MKYIGCTRIFFPNKSTSKSKEHSFTFLLRGQIFSLETKSGGRHGFFLLLRVADSVAQTVPPWRSEILILLLTSIVENIEQDKEIWIGDIFVVWYKQVNFKIKIENNRKRIIITVSLYTTFFLSSSSSFLFLLLFCRSGTYIRGNPWGTIPFLEIAISVQNSYNFRRNFI